MQLKTQQSFVARFSDVARATPKATAIVSAGEVAYTYSELLDTASNLSAQLRAVGVGREVVVGILVPKSPEYIVAMLAVWLAGGAFVPIDPRLPEERTNFILKEANIRVCVDYAPHSPYADDGSLLVVQLDAPPESDSTNDGVKSRHAFVESGWDMSSNYTIGVAESAEESTSPDDLAYIIFTSGSTGEPKGVMVTHRGIVNFLDAQIKGFYLNKESRALFFLSTNFDASVSDIGTALLSGAALCLEPEASLKPGPEFLNILSDRRITHLDIPPSLLAVLEPEDMPDSLETIIIGGEACAPNTVRRWAEKFAVVNVYGPTEATVCTSFVQCDADSWARPLIGDPIPGVEYLVLDEDLVRVPPGTEGELFIRGIGLARGYLNKPELTARKFILRDGERLYRTGDLVREYDSGDIEFLGRTDRQFKVRGMLIEPEEIEARLKEHPAVQNAAVLKRPLGAAGRDVLVGFLSVRAESAPDAAELRTYLCQRLPKWMVPQHFEFLSVLPSTLTGKVNMSRLKTLALTRAAQTLDEAPQTPTEVSIAQIWQEVLSIPQVSRNDDFFDLGGDSFGIIEVSAAAEASGLKLPPAVLMTHTRLSLLAAAIDSLYSRGAHKNNELEASGGMTSSELRADVRLSSEWMELLECAAKRPFDFTPGPETVVLTGAAGFLGSRLLYELLSSKVSKIYCVVRATSATHALARIESALAHQKLSLSERTRNKIVPVCGDLQQVRFGLPDLLWRELAGSADTVFHCAAQVNMLLPYSKLRPSNVGGTFEVIRLLCEGRRKELHYASTLSVIVATDQNEGVALESDDLASTRFVYGGYAQTKWASEVLLRSVEDKVGPILHHRFGLITGDTESGVTSESDFLTLFVRGVARLGCIPIVGDDICVDISPIDFCARAMVQVAVQPPAMSRCNTYHIANPVSLKLSDLVRNMRACGIRVETVNADQFLVHAGEISQADAAMSAACLALCRCIGDEQVFERCRTMDLFQATNIVFDSRNLRAALVGSNISCPPPSDELIRLYINNALSL